MTKSIRFLFAAFLLTYGLASADGPDSNSWSYEGATAPEHWGDLKSQYQECKTGQAQSPINIETNVVQKSILMPISTHYLNTVVKVENTGKTIQVNFKDGGQVTLPSGTYALKQLHFHTPSEETVNGKPFPIEAHLVHENANGKLAVAALFFESGKENGALRDIFSRLPQEKEGEFQSQFDASSLIHGDLAYYNYFGSLTTPPCGEGVDWYVLKRLDAMSTEQIVNFQKLFPMNARPVQPINNRIIKESN
jgi:carbonic anhydrase